jgi:hypothetical protein
LRDSKKGKSKSSTLGAHEKSIVQELIQQQSKSVGSSPTEEKKKGLTVSDGIGLVAQKSIQRKEMQKKVSEQMKELQAEQTASQGSSKKEESLHQSGEEGKLRQWKV